MKAIVYSEYGGPEVLQLTEVEMAAPGPDEIRVKVHAAAVNPADWHLVRGVPFPIRMVTGGFTRPTPRRRVGADFSGTIDAIGPGVTGVALGDPVFGLVREGALAEYVTVPADRVAPKPDRITFEQAAGIPTAGLTALQLLRDKLQMRVGHRVLIVGAAGGIGSFAVQIAKAWGAHVTGVQSTSALDLVRALGADRVIDYTTDDFTTGDARYAGVLDNVCNRKLADVRRVLKPDGTLVPNGGGRPDKSISILGMIRTLAMRPFRTQKIVFGVTTPTRADLQGLADLIQAGTVTPVIDRVYPLADTAKAFRHLEAGHAHGKIVVTIQGQA